MVETISDFLCLTCLETVTLEGINMLVSGVPGSTSGMTFWSCSNCGAVINKVSETTDSEKRMLKVKKELVELEREFIEVCCVGSYPSQFPSIREMKRLIKEGRRSAQERERLIKESGK